MRIRHGSVLTWWIHEVKMHEIVNTEFLQLQHNGAQIRPVNTMTSCKSAMKICHVTILYATDVKNSTGQYLRISGYVCSIISFL